MLLSATLLSAAFLLLTGEAPAGEPTAECTCADAIETNGWCRQHHVGYVGGVEIRSERLYEALDAHGHDVDLSTFDCPGCREAIAKEGFCEEHRIGFAGKQAYFSRLTYELARAEKRRLSDITCPTCRKNAESHGWCDADKIGMVGLVAIKERGDYDQVAKALAILQLANEAAPRCEICATAIALDGYCPACRVYYKDGRSIAPPPPAEATAPALR